MVSYDLMDAMKRPPDTRVFQHYIDSADKAVDTFADKVTQVGILLLQPDPRYSVVWASA